MQVPKQFKHRSVLYTDCSSDFQVLFSTAGLTNCLLDSSGLMGRPFVFSPPKLTSEKLIQNTKGLALSLNKLISCLINMMR